MCLKLFLIWCTSGPYNFKGGKTTFLVNKTMCLHTHTCLQWNQNVKQCYHKFDSVCHNPNPIPYSARIPTSNPILSSAPTPAPSDTLAEALAPSPSCARITFC